MLGNLRILSAGLVGLLVFGAFALLGPFLLDVFSEIRYSIWSHSVTRQYAKQYGSTRHRGPAVAEDDSRYNVPLVILCIILAIEVVLFFVL